MQPALEFLVSRELGDISRDDHEFGRQIVATIVAFSSQSRSQAHTLLFYLREFDPELIAEPELSSSVRSVVKKLISDVAKTNSSIVTAEIQALLLLPGVSGESGVSAALDALEAILRSASNERPSIGLPTAYACVLSITGRRAEFAKVLGDAYVERRWKAILSLVHALWATAVERPMVLASFSIPQATAPSTAIVHNWTYASMRLADELEAGPEMLATLKNAMSVDTLRDAIELAFATGALADEGSSLGERREIDESNEVFYSALGRRLVRMLTLEREQAQLVCKALLEQCLILRSAWSRCRGASASARA